MRNIAVFVILSGILFLQETSQMSWKKPGLGVFQFAICYVYLHDMYCITFMIMPVYHEL